MSAIDMHTHAFPDDLAKRAIGKLQDGSPWRAVGKGTIKSLLKSMDAADIDVSVVCTIATRPDLDHAQGILEWCGEIRSERIEPFPSVNPAMPGAADFVRRIAEEGFIGIKLHPMYQDFIADEPRLDPIYAAAAKNNLAVTIHCGQDIAYPDAGDRASPARMRNVVERHKNLKLICTHMGGWRDWQDSRKHLAGAACLIETSFSLEELGPQAAIEFIRAHGVDQVMFGTDWPWQDQKTAVATLKAVGLSEDELRQVMWSNAARLLGY